MAGPLFQPYYIAKILDGPLNLCKKHLFPTLMQNYEGNRQIDKVTYSHLRMTKDGNFEDNL